MARTAPNISSQVSWARLPGKHAVQASVPVSTRQPASFLTVLFWIVNLVVGGYPLGEGIYISQLLLVAFLIWKIFTRTDRKILFRLGWSVALFLVMAGLTMAAGNTGSERYIPEFFKTVLLVLGAFILWGDVRWPDLVVLSRIFPPVVLGVVAFVLLTDQGGYYGTEGRFGVPWWGSPNTSAFVMCIAIMLWTFEMQSRAEQVHHSSDKALVLGLESIVLLALVSAVIYTDSQGGEFATAVILLRNLGVRPRHFLYFMPFGLIAFWTIGFEIPELIGSGRPIIWATLLAEQYQSTFDHWLFGFGPGSIDFRPWFTARVLSAHSMFVEILYNWGIFAGAAFVVALCRYARRISGASLSRTKCIFIEASFVGLVAGFFFDTYAMSAQFSWLGACVLAAGGVLPKSAK